MIQYINTQKVGLNDISYQYQYHNWIFATPKVQNSKCSKIISKILTFWRITENHDKGISKPNLFYIYRSCGLFIDCECNGDYSSRTMS